MRASEDALHAITGGATTDEPRVEGAGTSAAACAGARPFHVGLWGRTIGVAHAIPRSGRCSEIDLVFDADHPDVTELLGRPMKAERLASELLLVLAASPEVARACLPAPLASIYDEDDLRLIPIYVPPDEEHDVTHERAPGALCRVKARAFYAHVAETAPGDAVRAYAEFARSLRGERWNRAARIVSWDDHAESELHFHAEVRVV
jgi:hypothetical protein